MFAVKYHIVVLICLIIYDIFLDLEHVCGVVTELCD